VQARTGFDLGPLEDVPSTAPPAAEELRLLRQVVRPRMIETGTYADWARTHLQSP
jgi:hypothetical protein